MNVSGVSALVRRSLAVPGLAVIALGAAVSGCQDSSSSSSPSSSGPAAAAPAAASSASSATATSGTSATIASSKALCLRLPAADVATLFSTSVGPAQAGTGSVTCYFAPAGQGTNAGASLAVVIDAVYGAATYPGTVTSLGASPQPITGVGDKAVWASSQPGYGAPNVVAVKGNTSCYVQSPSDLSVLTLKTTGGTQVSDADAAAYAQTLGALRADIFAGK